jgi:hypothetical protein
MTRSNDARKDPVRIVYAARTERCSSALGAVPIVMLVEDVPLPLVTP